MPAQSFPIRRAVAELIGTFLLTFAVSASLTLDYAVPTPLVAALTLMTLAYLLGPISGAHVNPAVTVALFTLKKMKFSEALIYVISQLLGAFAASLLIANLVDPRVLVTGDPAAATIGELLGTFVLAFGVCMVVLKRIDASVTGFVVGLSLFTGIAVASAGSLGIINPAVALGLGVLNPLVAEGLGSNLLVYALVPLIGGYLAALSAHWMSAKN